MQSASQGVPKARASPGLVGACSPGKCVNLKSPKSLEMPLNLIITKKYHRICVSILSAFLTQQRMDETVQVTKQYEAGAF